MLVSEGRILLTHWVAAPGLQAGWTLPGGGLEIGESPADAAVREVREETGYDVELTRLLGVDSEHYSAEERAPGRPRRPLHSLRVIYLARVVAGELTVEVGGSTDDARWIELADVTTLRRVGLVDAAVALWRDAQGVERVGPAVATGRTPSPALGTDL